MFKKDANPLVSDFTMTLMKKYELPNCESDFKIVKIQKSGCDDQSVMSLSISYDSGAYLFKLDLSNLATLKEAMATENAQLDLTQTDLF